MVVPEEFREAMDDDLNVPQALAVLHDRVRAGNAALDAEQLENAATSRGEVLAMTTVLGINPLDPQWQSTGDVAVRDALHNLIRRLLAQRQEARAARDFAAADRIRAELADAGILIEDGPNGSHWRIDGE